MTPERAKKVLRDYEDLSAEERNDEERKRLSYAVDSLHPETKRNRLDADTIDVIDFLREYSGDDAPVTGLDTYDILGLGAEGMRRVIEKAIDDHGVWIGDNSDTETRPPKVIYFIAGEGDAPADWTGYVPGKRDDNTTSDRAGRMQEKRMHVAFLRAYAYFPPEGRDQGARQLSPTRRRIRRAENPRHHRHAPGLQPESVFQMIGRGLRGVKNGGNDRCLILNVRDNIENFGRTLAFVDLECLWEGSDRSPN